MPTNDFKPFATAGGANVSTQAEYLALAALSTGWQSGKASSKEVNKAVRQATFIAAALAQFVSDKGAVDVLDDGNLAGFGTKLISALNKTSQPLDATLTALAALVGAANKLPYFNGADTAALTDLTQVGRDIIGKSDIAAVLTYLGLTAITTVSGSADNFPYFTGEKSAKLTPLTDFARNLLSKPDAIDSRTALGLTAITSMPGDVDSFPYFVDAKKAALTKLTAFARTLLGREDALDMRTTLELNAIASITGSADSLPYFTGEKSARLTPLTDFARNLLSKPDAIDSRTALGLGSAATRNVGTGSTQIPDMSSFSNSIATGGYQRLPGGLIIQWGLSPQIASAASVAITYPIPFPTKRLSIAGNPQGVGQGNPGSPVFDVGTVSGCNVSTWGSYNYQAMWIAIGY